MKKTKVIKDKKQTRTTIPKEYVDEFEVVSGDEMIWEIKGDKLKGELRQ